MWKLFAVVIKLSDGRLFTTHMFGESNEHLKSLIIKSGMKPVLISQEW